MRELIFLSAHRKCCVKAIVDFEHKDKASKRI